jgi:hypothetical protein
VTLHRSSIISVWKQGCFKVVSAERGRTTTLLEVTTLAHSTVCGVKDTPVAAPVFIGESEANGGQNAFGNFVGNFHLNCKQVESTVCDEGQMTLASWRTKREAGHPYLAVGRPFPFVLQFIPDRGEGKGRPKRDGMRVCLGSLLGWKFCERGLRERGPKAVAE